MTDTPRTKNGLLGALPRMFPKRVAGASRSGFRAPHVLAFQAAFLRRRFVKAGLIETRVDLGADRVAVWHNVRGERPIVMLLHGFGASAVWQWAAQVEALAESFDLVVPDLLWFGESTSENDDFHPDHQVAAMLGALEALGVSELHALVGLSYGGMLAWEIASREAIPIDRVVFTASPGPAYTRADLEGLLRRFDVSSLPELFLPREVAGVQTLLGLAYHRKVWVPRFARKQVLAEFCDKNRRQKSGLLTTLESELENLSARISSLATPSLVIWGAEDPVFPRSLGERLARQIGDHARLAVIPKARHAANMEFARPFNRHLRRFLIDPRPALG